MIRYTFLLTIALNTCTAIFAQVSDPVLVDSAVAAAWEGNLTRVSQLEDRGVLMDEPNAQGLSAWQAARLTGRGNMMRWMKGKDIDTLQEFPPRSSIADWLFRSLDDKELPGAAVLFAEGEAVRYRKGFGLARVSPPRPVQPETVFRIGSITKQFTAAAILKLAEEGKLSLNDSLARWLPDFPRADRITVHQLLNHTSGIHPYTESPSFLAGVSEPVRPEALLDSIAAFKSDFQPGKGWKYSNSGYYILGYLVEKISGKPYGKYLEDTFFKPLGMTQTGVYRNEKAPAGEALGYSAADGVVEPAPDWNMTWAGGAGNLYSTLDDLLRWNLALHGGKVLQDEMYRAMTTPYSYTDGSPSENGQGYGYGLSIGSFRGEPIYGHSGGLQGFLGFLGYLPEREATVITLANAMPNEYIVPEEKAMELISAWYGEGLSGQRTIGSAQFRKANPLKVYSGYYEYPQGTILQIREKGGALTAQLTGQAEMEIVPVAIDSFAWSKAEASAKFRRAASGQILGLTHYQNGRSFEAPKFEFPKVVEMDTTAFDRLAGTYSLGSADIRVFRKGTEYFAQLTGQSPFPVFPKSENELFFKVVRASLRFEQEGEAPATAVTLVQGGTEQRATRKE